MRAQGFGRGAEVSGGDHSMSWVRRGPSRAERACLSAGPLART
jgi:hypothetical protein